MGLKQVLEVHWVCETTQYGNWQKTVSRCFAKIVAVARRNEATAHLEGLKAVRGTEKASSPDGAAPEVQAPSGEQGGSSAVEDTAIAAVTKELDGQKPKTEVKSSDPDIVVPTDVLRRDPDFDKKVAAAIAVAATAGKKITENQAKTALLNEHYQAWAKDQSNIPNF